MGSPARRCPSLPPLKSRSSESGTGNPACHYSPSLPVSKMPSKHSSPARRARSIKRAMQYKEAILIDLYNLDLTLDYEKNEIKWNVNETVVLTLKPDCPILETRYVFNPSFTTFPLGRRISAFQQMWRSDQSSFIFFTGVLSHLQRNTLSCDHLCANLNLSCFCRELLESLATAGKPPDTPNVL